MTTLRPTRTRLIETDTEDLKNNCIYVTFTPESSEHLDHVGLECNIIFDLYAKRFPDLFEGVIKLPQQEEYDEFVVVFKPNEISISERLQIAMGSQTITFDDGCSVDFKRTAKQLAEIKESNNELFKVLFENLESCLVQGKPLDASMVWEPNPPFVRTSTPAKPNGPPDPQEELVQNLVTQIENAPTETIQKLLEALTRETERRGIPVPKDPKGPKPQPKPNPPPTPIPNHPPQPQPGDGSFIDPNLLGETIAKANESLIETLANHGLLRTQIPKISQFSGDDLKGDVSFEQWEYEVEILKATHTSSAIREAITKSLKGSAAEALRALGPVATLEQILTSFKGKYGIAASYDTLMSSLYTFTQQSEEKVPQFATKIETKLSSIKWKFPGRITSDMETKILRDRLFFGIKKDIRDSIRYRYSDGRVTYAELLKYARESEDENQDENSSPESSKDKKDKSKAKSSSAIASTSVQNTSNPDLVKLTQVAEKVQKETEKAETLLKELLETINKYNNPGTGNRGRGNGSRGRGNGFRGRGRGRGNGNGFGRGNNQNQNQNHQASNNQQPQNQRRTPRCFHCINNGADRTDHWPNQCDWLKTILQDWHSSQSGNGHQAQTQNLNN